MEQAITYFYQWFSSYLDLVFNYFTIRQNVTIGWVCVGILVFGILITSLLNLPRAVPHVTITDSEEHGSYHRINRNYSISNKSRHTKTTRY